MIAAARYEVGLTRLRFPGGVLLIGGLVLAHLPEGVGLPCPLRSLTGIPCPFCGLTTSVRAAFGGHIGTSIAAAPLGLLVIAIAALVVLGVAPRKLVLHPFLIVVPLFAEWMFELHRFGLI
jgi:hypothetical protein